VIEIDGGQHDYDEHRKHDEARTAYLEKQGMKVMRFWNNEVMENTIGVLEAIREALGLHPSPQPSPHALIPSPSPKGRREQTAPLSTEWRGDGGEERGEGEERRR